MLTRARLRSETGMTLTEVMVGMTVATIVSLAVFGLVETTMKRSGEIAGRVAATQRGRIAMDQITRQIRSQICPTPGVVPMAGPPLAVQPDGDTASFYMTFSDGRSGIPAELRTLVYEPGARRIVEKIYRRPLLPDGSYGAYPAPQSPTLQRVIVDNVVRDRPAGATADTPVFRYFGFNAAVPPRPDAGLAVPLSDVDRAEVARIVIRFRVLPPGARAATRGDLLLEDDIHIRDVNPNDLSPEPVCT